MNFDQDTPSEQNFFSGQLAELIQFIRSGEEANIQHVLLLAKELGHPPAFQQYQESLLPLYQLALRAIVMNWVLLPSLSYSN